MRRNFIRYQTFNIIIHIVNVIDYRPTRYIYISLYNRPAYEVDCIILIKAKRTICDIKNNLLLKFYILINS